MTTTLQYPENTHLLHKGKYHCTADLLFDHQQIYLFGQIQTSQSGQPYSDTFPYEVSECSLDVLIPVANRLSHGAL